MLPGKSESPAAGAGDPLHAGFGRAKRKVESEKRKVESEKRKRRRRRERLCRERVRLCMLMLMLSAAAE
jgi:hypothetical protein